MYHGNGNKFHTTEWGKEKKINNTGVCVTGNTGYGESDWHGVVNEILELDTLVNLLKGLCYSLVNDMIQHVSGEHVNTITTNN